MNVNAALERHDLHADSGFHRRGRVTITSNDLGNTGSGGPLTDTDTVSIQIGVINVSIQDAQIVEPASGTAFMVFTVTLSAPAPNGGVSVNFTSQPLPRR